MPTLDKETAREMFLAVHEARLELAPSCSCRVCKSKPGKKKHVDEPGIIAGQKAIAAVFAEWRKRVLTALENNPPVKKNERRTNASQASAGHGTTGVVQKAYGGSAQSATGNNRGSASTSAGVGDTTVGVRRQKRDNSSPDVSKTDERLEADFRAFSAKTEALLKSWDEAAHPRNPKGTPGGGEFRNQTDSPAFKNWFGDSKITVDGQAGSEPLVVYHGTNADNIQAFDTAKIGSRYGYDKQGFYFTDDKIEARYYSFPKGSDRAERMSPGGKARADARIVSAYIKIENPLTKGVISSHPEFSRQLYHSAIDFYDTNRHLIEKLSTGHDGVVINNIEGQSLYVVFSPTQIKSAIGNRGTFDPQDADITKAGDGISKAVESLETNHPRLSAARKVWNWLRKAIGDDEELDPDDLDIEGMAEDGAFDPDMDEFDVEAILNEAFPNAGAEAIAELAAAMRVAQMEGCDTGIGLAGAQLGLDPEDIAAAVKEPLERAMEEYALKFSESTWARIDGSIKDQLVDGLVDGQAPKEMAETIGDYFTELEPFESLRIARTEFARGQVRAAVSSFDSEGIKLCQVLATPDCCSCCSGYADRIWPIEMMFEVFPFHPSCRCSILPVYELEEGQEVETEPPTNVFDDPDLRKDPWPTIEQERAAKENADAMADVGGVGKALADGEASSVAKYAPDQPRDSKGEFTTSMGEKVKPLKAVAFQHNGVTYAGKPGENHGILQDRLKREGVTGVDWPAVEEDYWKSQGFVDQEGNYLNREDAEKKLRMDAESGEMRRFGALLEKSVDGWAFIQKYNRNHGEHGRFVSGAGLEPAAQVKHDLTNTPEFKQWFGNSKLRNPDGAPMKLYHQTSGANVAGIDSEGFDLKGHVAARGTDEGMPDGIFLKTEPNDIFSSRLTGVIDGTSQMPLYVRMENPLYCDTRYDVNVWAGKDEEYGRLATEAQQYDKQMSAEFDHNLKTMWSVEGLERGQYAEVRQKSSDFIAKWRAGNLERASAARARLTKLIADDGYDGLVVQQDVGGYGRTVKTYVALNPNQVKSIWNEGTWSRTDNRIGKAFNPKEADITKSNPNRDDHGRYASGGGVTSTEEFKKWFGESKAVDGNGKALTLYHGTPTPEFSQVRPTFYAAKSPEYASVFAGTEADERWHPAVYPVYLKVENPLDFREFGLRQISKEDMGKFLTDHGVKVDYDIRQVINAAAYDGTAKAWQYIRQLTDIASGIFKHAGYDGIIQNESVGDTKTEAWVAFEPWQVKSATGNNGKFDSNDIDITKSDADLIAEFVK